MAVVPLLKVEASGNVPFVTSGTGGIAVVTSGNMVVDTVGNSVVTPDKSETDSDSKVDLRSQIEFPNTPKPGSHSCEIM